MDDSAIICDEVIDADTDVEAKSNGEGKSNDQETKTVPRNFNEKNITCKMHNFYILLAFFKITIALLIAVSIYCYLIICCAKQLLPFNYTNNEI